MGCNYIEQLRLRAGYKHRTDLIKALKGKYTARQLQTWETGVREISLSQATDIADVLGCSLDDIAGRTDRVHMRDSRKRDMVEAYSRLSEMGRDAAAASVKAMWEHERARHRCHEKLDDSHIGKSA